MRRRRRIRSALVVGVGVLTLVLGSAAPASSAIFYTGFTWYADGAFYKEGPSGTVVRAYATGAVPGRTYRLYSTPFIPERDWDLCDSLLTELNPHPRVANSSGFIGTTAGRVTGPPGDYMICFVDPTWPGGNQATIYVQFRIR